jgi:polyisoprenoid-binding protein YceI
MKLVRRFLLAGLACLPLVAGAQTPAPAPPPPSPAAKATGSDSPVAETAGPTRVLRYRFVPEQSTLTFELPTTFRVVKGKTGAWHGSVEVDPVSPGMLKARLQIRAESIETGNSRRDLDVRDKVLEAAKFPEIVFEAKTYKGSLSNFDAGATITAEVTGELTIHGVTKPLQSSLQCAVLADHVVVAGAVPVFWKAFGLRDMSRLFLKIKDPMLVVFKLWAVPEKD